jgi:glycosyltransferase involved in cell wall biosynthesis
MNILFIFPFFSLPHGGGTVEVMYNLCVELSKRGHSVSLYTSDYELDDQYLNTLISNGVAVHIFHCYLKILGLFITPSMIYCIKNNIKNFDLIHLHIYRSIQELIIHYYAIDYNIPYIVQAHGAMGSGQNKIILKRIYDLFIGRRILNDSSKIIASTEAEAKQYIKVGIDSKMIEIIPNGVDLKDYDQLPVKGLFRRKFSIRDDEKLVLFVGRINKIKGLDLLIKAFAGLAKERDDVKLAIVGQDDGFLADLNDLAKLYNINNRLIITGPLYSINKIEAYNDADIFVMPSMYESFGMSIIEACACSTPVIITNRCAISNALDKIAGYSINYDYMELSHALNLMLKNDNARKIFGANGRSMVFMEYNWINIVSKYVNLYQMIYHNHLD